MQTEFDELTHLAMQRAEQISIDHVKRLKFEISEIIKQGAELSWVKAWKSQKIITNNPAKLVLPYVLGMIKDDPSTVDMITTAKASEIAKFRQQHKKLPTGIIKDTDMPDIDIDCISEARDAIKEHAFTKYSTGNLEHGIGSVCAVGTWTTYKFKSALTDAAVALGKCTRYDMERYTSKLPENVDDMREKGVSQCKGMIKSDTESKECGHIHDDVQCPVCGSEDTENPTLGKLMKEFEQLQEIQTKYPGVIDTAKEMIGRIKNIGTHAAALIITDRNLFGNIPLAKVGSKGAWTSMWTEGRNAQLSKYGYVKWDWLGLKTLDYVFKSCKLIYENRGISFGDKIEGWEDIDPENNQAGYFIDANGVKHIITFDDEEVFKLVNTQKTDAIFQFDTDLAKSTLQNGVKSFQDLMLLNAMGHPGPLDSIPEAMENRNNPNNGWQKALHPDIFEILKDTYGVIVYQEQLAAIWMKLAGFTAPEAQEARKAVAKKWTHKLKPIRDKWMGGATESLGADQASQWWDKMVSFGRYAFNKSHAVAYCLMAYRCLWLKAHFAPEYWAAVLSGCHPDKLERYISVAKSEGWEPTAITKLGTVQEDDGLALGSLNIDDMRNEFGVHRNTITQGLIGVKGIGEKAAEVYAGKGTYHHIDEFITTPERRNKPAIERFIKLGAFKHLPNHHNSKALYYYYLFNHSTGSNDAKKDKDSIMQALAIKQGWNEQSIKQEQQRQKEEYRKLYPKKVKLPAKIEKWKPNIMVELSNFNDIFEHDFTLDERLTFQKEYLGYWLESPLQKYRLEGGRTIEEARNAGKHDSRVELEVVIIDIVSAKTKTEKPYHKMIVSDGTQQTSVFLWPTEKVIQRQEYLVPGMGVKIPTMYNSEIKLFSVRKSSLISKLRVRDEIQN